MPNIKHISVNGNSYDIRDDVLRGIAFVPEVVVTAESGSFVTAVCGDKTATGTSNGTCTLSLPKFGTWTITATKGSDTSSETLFVDRIKQYEMEILYLPAKKALNDTSWEDIRIISDAGQAANFWNVGDRKAVQLSIAFSYLTLNETYYAFIIGFDHNSAKEGTNRIHFQFGKSALTGGKDICFVDTKYDGGGSFIMNSSLKNTNEGGWNDSRIRNNICGTNLLNYSGTFIAALPSALRTVLKPVVKYTNNTGNSTAASAVTATTDYIFLLSEYEVFGTITYSNTYEANNQVQYAYYSSGNSKVKYRHNSTSTAANWWLRSPRASNTTFVMVSSNGSVGTNPPSYSYGFTPAFCV